MTTTLQAARAMAEQAKRQAAGATDHNGQIIRSLAAVCLKLVEALEQKMDYPVADTIVRETQRP